CGMMRRERSTVSVALFLAGTFACSLSVRPRVLGSLSPFAAEALKPAGRARNWANQQSSPMAASGATTSEGGQTKPHVNTYSLPPEKYKRAVEFARTRYRLYPIEVAYGILVLWIILHWGLAVRFRDWAEARSSRRFVQALIYSLLLLVTLGVLGLPGEI